jgi:ribosomal protein S18 acetylase RimI-like enzyme
VDLTAETRTVYLYGLSVDPGHGGAGLGAALLGAVERRAEELGHDGLLLETGKDASWLVAWYQRLGFEVIGESDPGLASPRTVMMLKRW